MRSRLLEAPSGAKIYEWHLDFLDTGELPRLEPTISTEFLPIYEVGVPTRRALYRKFAMPMSEYPPNTSNFVQATSTEAGPPGSHSTFSRHAGQRMKVQRKCEPSGCAGLWGLSYSVAGMIVCAGRRARASKRGGRQQR